MASVAGFVRGFFDFFSDTGSSPAAEKILHQTGIQEVDDIISKWDDLKEAVQKIFEPAEILDSDQTWVVTLFDAKTVLEDFRVGALKDRLTTNYDTIKAAFYSMFHPPAEAAAAAAAHDPEVRSTARLVLKVESVFQTAQFLLREVAKVEDAVIDIVKLFDLVGSEQEKLNAMILPQRNRNLVVSSKKTDVATVDMQNDSATLPA